MFHEYNPHMSCYLIHEVGATQGKFRQSLLSSLYLLDIPIDYISDSHLLFFQSKDI